MPNGVVLLRMPRGAGKRGMRGRGVCTMPARRMGCWMFRSFVSGVVRGPLERDEEEEGAVEVDTMRSW